jgi:hypothetical protein
VTFNNKQMEILNKLRNEGIKFCVDYIEEWKETEIEKINPEYFKSQQIVSFKNSKINFEKIKKDFGKSLDGVKEIG